MLTILLSHTELEYVCEYWDAYVGQGDEHRQSNMDTAMSLLSDDTCKAFLGALQDFEFLGIEFQVRLAPDDRVGWKKSSTIT